MWDELAEEMDVELTREKSNNKAEDLMGNYCCHGVWPELIPRRPTLEWRKTQLNFHCSSMWYSAGGKCTLNEK